MEYITYYLNFGGFEGRDLSIQFDSVIYMKQNPDVKALEICPRVDFLKDVKSKDICHNNTIFTNFRFF